MLIEIFDSDGREPGVEGHLYLVVMGKYDIEKRAEAEGCFHGISSRIGKKEVIIHEVVIYVFRSRQVLLQELKRLLYAFDDRPEGLFPLRFEHLRHIAAAEGNENALFGETSLCELFSCLGLLLLRRGEG